MNFCTLAKLFVTIFTLFLSFSTPAFSQQIHNDYQGTFKAKVIKIISEEKRDVGWNNVLSTYRNIELEILDGPKKGVIVNFETDFPELSKGDRVFVNYLVDVGGGEIFSITNIDRTYQIWFLIILFIAVIIFFGGWQGLRSLISLLGSFIVIIYVLLPAILAGWHPLFVCILIASAILFFAIFFTHGFNKESIVAYSGTMISIIITSLLALFAVHVTRLSGFSDDYSLYLNFNTGGSLDFTGLLLGAIIVGVLGVLDDISITQAAIVTELYDSNKNITKFEVYKRAMRVGKEHVGALVNTLVLAYTGAALPMMLLFSVYKYDFNTIINLEVFATEIVRTIIGSIGLILTVPIVTVLAVYQLKNYKSKHSHHHHHHHH